MTAILERTAAEVGPERIRVELTRRETEVLRAWLQTESKEEAGQRLFIAACTVAVHVQRVRAKYAAADRPAGTKVGLAVCLLQDGYIALGDLH